MPTLRFAARAACSALAVAVGLAACGALDQPDATSSPTRPASNANTRPTTPAANANDAGATSPTTTTATQGNQPAAIAPMPPVEGALGLYVNNLLVTANDANLVAGTTFRPGADLNQTTARLSYHQGLLVVGGKLCLAAREGAGAQVTLAPCGDGNALTWALSDRGALLYRLGENGVLGALAWSGCTNPSASNAACRLIVSAWNVQVDDNTRIETTADGVAVHLASSPNVCLTAQGSKTVGQTCSVTDPNQRWRGFGSVTGGASGRGAPSRVGTGTCLYAAGSSDPARAGLMDCNQAPPYWYLMFGFLRTDLVSTGQPLFLGVDPLTSQPIVSGSIDRTRTRAPWTIGPMPQP